MENLPGQVTDQNENAIMVTSSFSHCHDITGVRPGVLVRGASDYSLGGAYEEGKA